VAELRARRQAGVAERRHDRPLHGQDVLRHPVDVHDRVADELAGAVVGQLAAARRLDHVDAQGAVVLLAQRQVGLGAAAPDRVDRRVLEQQHRLRQLAGAHAVAQALLQRRGLGVLDAAEVAHPQLGHARELSTGSRS
jgi:hypothetical protein